MFPLVLILGLSVATCFLAFSLLFQTILFYFLFLSHFALSFWTRETLQNVCMCSNIPEWMAEYLHAFYIFAYRTGILASVVTTKKSKTRFVSSWKWCIPILLGSQQDLWLAGRSERPHKVAGSWPDGLHVARSCNSRAVCGAWSACAQSKDESRGDQHEENVGPHVVFQFIALLLLI